jgi:tetratricopeptide (TPR) repeat protein
MKKKNIQVKESGDSPYLSWVGGFLLLLLTGFIYQSALDNQFTNYDERAYVSENRGIQQLNGEMIAREFKSFYMGNYHPLTMISYAIDYSIYGMDPSGYILTNILLHCVSTLVVYMLLIMWTKNPWASLAGGLLFSLHPLHVESVAWIAERKDVLYTAFASISILMAYLWYTRSSSVYWILSLCFLLLACLSKGMAVVVSPIILLIGITLKIEKEGKLDWKELYKFSLNPRFIPFLLTSLAFGYVAILAQAEAAAIRTDTGNLPFYAKILYPTYGIWFYLQKFIFPIPLSAHYEYPSLKNFLLLLSPILTIGLGTGLWMIRNKFPEWILAFIFYLIGISIVLQILPVGKAIAADRYFYFASIGFSIAIAWRLNKASQKLYSFICIGLFVLMGYSLTIPRIKIWKDSKSLWEDTFKENQHVPFVLFNLGVSLEKSGKENDLRAMELYQKALAIDSTYFEPYNNYGILLNQYGQPGSAIPLYYKAIKLNPNNSDTYNNLATALQALGKYEEALSVFTKSLEVDPNNPSPHNNLGTLLNELGRYNEAAYHYNEALRLKVNEPRVWYNLGNLYYQIQKTDSSIYCYQKALEMKPDYPDAMGNMGVIYFSRKEYQTALTWYEKALQVDPNFRDAYFNMGVTWFYLNDKQKSKAYFEKAASLGHPAAQQWIQSNP